jgi:hypothetical protein
MGSYGFLSSRIIGSHFSPVFRLSGHYVAAFKGFLNQVATSDVPPPFFWGGGGSVKAGVSTSML